MVNILVRMPGRCSTPGAPRKEEQVPVSYHRAWSTPWSLWWLLRLWRGRDAISFNYSAMSIFTWSSPRSAHTTVPGKQQWVGRWNRPRWDLDAAWIIIIIILLSWWYDIINNVVGRGLALETTGMISMRWWFSPKDVEELPHCNCNLFNGLRKQLTTLHLHKSHHCHWKANHLIPHHCLWSWSSPSSSSWPSPSFLPSSPSTSPSPCHASPKSPRLLFDAIAEQMFHIIPRQTLPCSFLFTSCSFSWNNLAASLMFTSFLSWLGNSFSCAFLKFWRIKEVHQFSRSRSHYENRNVKKIPFLL